MTAPNATPPAGWYPDPGAPSAGQERYWDGVQWTQELRAAGGDAAGPGVAQSTGAPAASPGVAQSAGGPGYHAGSMEGVPQHGVERMEQLKGGLFTSDLSVSEFLLIKQAGFEPLGLVVGSSIYHIGFQQSAWSQNQEMEVLSQAMYEARELAMTRMEEEADQLGADGIVGVRLDIGRYEWGAHMAEFIAIGTAVRHQEGALHRAPNGRPFTSDLSGQDFWTLLSAGYRPVGMVMGSCVYHVAHQGLRQMFNRWARTSSFPTTPRRSTTRASWRWSACRPRRRQCRPRASSACSSTSARMAGART